MYPRAVGWRHLPSQQDESESKAGIKVTAAAEALLAYLGGLQGPNEPDHTAEPRQVYQP